MPCILDIFCLYYCHILLLLLLLLYNIIYYCIVHDPKLRHFSVKDQYCDVTNEVFHETEYIGSESCHVKWYQKLYSPEKLKFTHDTCVGGYQLRYCAPGPCPGPGSGSGDEEVVQ